MKFLEKSGGDVPYLGAASNGRTNSSGIDIARRQKSASGTAPDVAAQADVLCR